MHHFTSQKPGSWADNFFSELDASQMESAFSDYQFDGSTSSENNSIPKIAHGIQPSQNHGQYCSENMMVSYPEMSPSIYSQSSSFSDAGNADTKELFDDVSIPDSSPGYEPQGYQSKPRSAKKPYEPQRERRGRGRPLKVDEGPSDVMQKRFYARNYREKQKKGQTQLTQVVIELYNAYTKGETIDPQTLKFVAEFAKKHREKC